MKPYIHARNTVRKFGGKEEDYQEIHDFLDSSKALHADMRHRALLHNAWGIFMCEKLFGERFVNEKGEIVQVPYITNSDGKKVQVRDVAEMHVIEDMGRIPSVSDYLKHLPMIKWLGGRRRPLQKRDDLVVD